MVDKLIELSLRRPFLILTFAGLLTLLGFYAFRTIPIDAFPDVTSVLVQVVTKPPGLSPEEVERVVTFPIEQQITGVPHLTELRSLTKVGLSLITVVFDDQMNINLARQLVLERLIEVKENLPPGSEPMMTPNSTGLGEVYQYYLEGPSHAGLKPAAVERELIGQRTVQDCATSTRTAGLSNSSRGSSSRSCCTNIRCRWTTCLRPWRTTTRMPLETYWRPMPKRSLSVAWD